jgi:TPR repeat protein
MPVEKASFSPLASSLLLRSERDDPEALYRLGVLYLAGTGVPKDERTGAVLVVAAAEEGMPGAQYLAGLLYGDGRGVGRDPAAELFWLRRAAERGSAEAQVRLGHMFRDGWVVGKDAAAALAWYRKAVEQGAVEALRAVMGLYAEGRAGLPRDREEVRRYCLALAERGDLTAQMMMGERFETGVDGPADAEQAFFWYTLAANQGSELAARLRDETARGMEARRIVLVREQVARWTPRAWNEARWIAFGDAGPRLLR